MTLPPRINKEDIHALLAKANIHAEPARIEYMESGGNNNIFRVSMGVFDFALKQYKTDPHDPRNRLGAEWNFLKNITTVTDKLPCPLPVSVIAVKEINYIQTLTIPTKLTSPCVFIAVDVLGR